MVEIIRVQEQLITYATRLNLGLPLLEVLFDSLIQVRVMIRAGSGALKQKNQTRQSQ